MEKSCLSDSGRTVRFGSYPQSRVEDRALIAALNEKADKLPKGRDDTAWRSYKYYIFNENDTDFMWYLDVPHEGGLYRGVYFTDYRPNDTSNTGDMNCQADNGYHPKELYWFKHEPLLWQILEEKNGKARLITCRCIDAQPYRNVVWNNSYVKSSIREWLNREFLHTAFDASAAEGIRRELVTNNMEDTDICDGDTPGSDTFDLIHLLSVEEAEALLPHGERQSTATDYARCQGIRVSPENSCSSWWLRSPYYSIDAWAQLVSWNPLFDFNTAEIGNTDIGIRPALWLDM